MRELLPLLKKSGGNVRVLKTCCGKRYLLEYQGVYLQVGICGHIDTVAFAIRNKWLR